MQQVVLPQFTWFGDIEIKIEVPDEWEVHVQIMKGEGKPPITREK